MPVEEVAYGRCVHIGWEEPSEENGNKRQFIAKVALERAPDWPIAVIWGRLLLQMSVVQCFECGEPLTDRVCRACNPVETPTDG